MPYVSKKLRAKTTYILPLSVIDNRQYTTLFSISRHKRFSKMRRTQKKTMEKKLEIDIKN